MSFILFILFNGLIIFLFADKYFLVKEYEKKIKTLEQKIEEKDNKGDVFIQNLHYYGVTEAKNE